MTWRVFSAANMQKLTSELANYQRLISKLFPCSGHAAPNHHLLSTSMFLYALSSNIIPSWVLNCPGTCFGSINQRDGSQNVGIFQAEASFHSAWIWTRHGKIQITAASVHFEKYVRQLKIWLDESYSSHLGEWLGTDGDEYKHGDNTLKKKYSTHQNFCNIDHTVCALHYTRTNKHLTGTFLWLFHFWNQNPLMPICYRNKQNYFFFFCFPPPTHFLLTLAIAVVICCCRCQSQLSSSLETNPAESARIPGVTETQPAALNPSSRRRASAR